MKGLVETVKKQGKYIVDLYNKVKSIEATTDSMPYKVYTALLTQSGGDNFQSQSSGAVKKGVTYYVNGGAIGITDFSNVGGQLQTPETGGYYFVATIDGIPNEYGGATADYNTGAPVATVLENTIGNIWFIYNGVGSYFAMSNHLFTVNKSMGLIGTPTEGVLNNNFAGINSSGDTTFIISIIEKIPLDDLLYNVPIEIRVYN